MRFRVHDLAAEQSVWSVPPIDMVPLKLRGEKLIVRAFDADANLREVEPVDGMKLESVTQRLFTNRQTARLHIHLAADDSYAEHVERFDVQQTHELAGNDSA